MRHDPLWHDVMFIVLRRVHIHVIDLHRVDNRMFLSYCLPNELFLAHAQSCIQLVNLLSLMHVGS